MNVSLYNQLANAKVCLNENTRIDKIIAETRQQIKNHEHFLNTCKSAKEYRKITGKSFIDKADRFFAKHARPNSEGVGYSILYYVYIFPFVAFLKVSFYASYYVCYFLGYPLFKQKEKIENKKYKSEYEAIIKNAKNQIVSLQNYIAELQKERKAFNEKKGNPLLALYEGYRREEAIDYMLESVKRYPNHFRSLKEVQNFLQQHYINLDEAERRNEERAERDKRHKETQEALKTIARNQEKIASDIERVEKETKGMYWW